MVDVLVMVKVVSKLGLTEVLCGFVVSTVDNLVEEVKVEDENCVTNFVVELGVGNVVVV